MTSLSVPDIDLGNRPLGTLASALFHEHLLREDVGIGYYPFVIARVGDRQQGTEPSRGCFTKSGTPEFIDERPGGSDVMVRWLERPLQLNIYGSAELLLFDGVKGGNVLPE